MTHLSWHSVSVFFQMTHVDINIHLFFSFLFFYGRGVLLKVRRYMLYACLNKHVLSPAGRMFSGLQSMSVQTLANVANVSDTE